MYKEKGESKVNASYNTESIPNILVTNQIADCRPSSVILGFIFINSTLDWNTIFDMQKGVLN